VLGVRHLRCDERVFVRLDTCPARGSSRRSSPGSTLPQAKRQMESWVSIIAQMI
jgi:hypothetical protein